jgi:hypothetical protein
MLSKDDSVLALLHDANTRMVDLVLACERANTEEAVQASALLSERVEQIRTLLVTRQQTLLATAPQSQKED